MSKKAAIAAIVVLASYACLATLWAGLATLGAGWQSIKRQSPEELLKKLALARPGVRLAEIRDQLGPSMGEWTNPDDVLAWGRVKEKPFCKNKKLFRFYASTPPCRAVDVYTDANAVIVYATWTGP